MVFNPILFDGFYNNFNLITNLRKNEMYDLWHDEEEGVEKFQNCEGM